MKLFRAIIFLTMALVCTWRATPAVITGPIFLTYSNTPYTGTILFRPMSTPLPYTPNLITGGDFRVVPATNGVFSVELSPGNYRVTVGADKAFVIDVPTNAATYTLLERITNSLAWNSAISPRTNSYNIANDTIEGVVRTYTTQASPVVWTTNDTVATWDYLGAYVYTNVPVSRKFGSDATDLFTIGDSFTFGAGSSAYTNSWPSVFAFSVGLSATNLANGSFSISDANWSAFSGWTVTNNTGPTAHIFNSPSTITENQNWSVLIGFNDIRTGTTSASMFRKGLDHLIHWLGIPTTAKRTAQSPDASTGSWTAVPWSNGIGSIGAYSSSGTLTWSNVIGSDVYLGYIGWGTNFGGSLQVAVDGVTVTNFSTASVAYGNREYINGSDANIPDHVGPYGNGKIDFCPQLLRLTDLGFTAHTVVVTASGNPVYVLWCAGNGWSRTARKGPNVFVGTIPRQSPWTGGGTDASHALFNSQLVSAVNSAKAGNIRSAIAHVSSKYIPSTHQSGDGVHPNNDGHTEIAEAFADNFSSELPSIASGLGVVGGSSGGAGSFSSISVSGTSSLVGNITGNGRLLMLPTAGAGGTSHRYGYGSVSASGVQIIASDTNLDRNLTIGGNYVSAQVNSTGAAANLSLGTAGQTVVVSGAATVAETLGVTGNTTLSGRLIVTPAATSGGHLHRIGQDGVSSSAVTLQTGDTSLDRHLTVNGNSIAAKVNSTGAAANMSLGTFGNNVAVSGSASVAQALTVTGSAGLNGGMTLGSTLTGSSGTEIPARFQYTVNQSGTAGSQGLSIEATTTALGSGSHRLINTTDDGIERFYVTTDGRIVVFSPNGTAAHTFRGVSDTDSRISFEASQTLDRHFKVTGNSINITRADGTGSEALSLNGNGALVSVGGYLRTASGIEFGSAGTQDRYGGGSPEGVIFADKGSTWRRTDGGASTIFYVKETGVGLNTGWVALGPPGAGGVASSRQILTTHSITGGGDLSTDRTLSLVNDTASPGNNKVYGTDGSGVRGWKNDPSGGGISITGTPVSGQVAEWTSASAIQGVAVTGIGDYVKNDSAFIVNAALTNPKTDLLDFEGSSSGFVTMTVPAAAGTHTIKLPTTTGAANSILKTDGSGQWGWFALGTDVQAYDAELLAIAGLTSAADTLPYFNGAGTATTTSLTAAGRALIDDANASAQRTTLGLAIGTDVQAQDAELAALASVISAADTLAYFSGSGTATTTTLTASGRALIDDASASAQRTTLGLAIGTDVQAFDADLLAIAGLTSAADKGIQFTGSGTAGVFDLTTAGKALLDDASASAQRTTLGLGTVATENTVPIGKGGTGQTTASAAFDALNGSETTVASATTTDLGAVASDKVSITGTTPITSFGTVAAGVAREGRFTGVLQLTHNGTSLILPGAANITTAVNDRFRAYSLGSGNWLVASFTKADGTAVVGGGSSSGTKTIAVWDAKDNEPPSTGYATVFYRNVHPTLAFDTGPQEVAIFRGRIPQGAVLTSGVTVYAQWAAASATSGTIGWDIAFERIDSGGQNLDTDNFGTAQTITAATVPGTSGITTTTSVNFSQAQLPTSLAAGDMYRIRIRRDVANDTAAGDAQLVQLEVRLQ